MAGESGCRGVLFASREVSEEEVELLAQSGFVVERVESVQPVKDVLESQESASAVESVAEAALSSKVLVHACREAASSGSGERAVKESVPTPVATQLADAEGIDERPGRQSDLSLYLGILPVLMMAALVAVLHSFFPKAHTGYEPSLLLPILNTVFLSLASGVVAYVAMRSYLASGLPSLLMLGSGVLALGAGAFLAGWLLVPCGPDVSTTIFNISLLVASIFHSASLGTMSPRGDAKRRRLNLAAAYLGVIAFTALTALAAITGITPLFYVKDVGPTALRQVVLSIALILFIVSSMYTLLRFFERNARFLYWYSMGLALLAVAIMGLLLTSVIGSLVGWAGRCAQFIAGFYFLMAVISATRDARARGVALNEAIAEIFRKSGEYWQDILATVSDAIISYDSTGRILQWNRAAERVFGYSTAEALANRLDLILPHGHSLSLDAESLGGVHGGRPVEVELRRNDGSLFSGEVSTSTREFSAGEVTTLVIRDVTYRKRTELALAQARSEAERRAAEMESFISSMSEGVVLVDSEGKAILANRAAVEILGTDPKLPLDERIRQYQVCHLDGTAMLPEETASHRALQGEVVKDMSYVLNAPECKSKVITVSSSPVRASDGRIIGATNVFRDTTDIARLERQKAEIFEREHHIAQVLQQAILPPEVPAQVPGYRVAVKYLPALREAEIGGDFYDVFDLGDNRTGVVIGDVTGKGLAAAIRVASARHAIRSYAYLDPSPARVMSLANDALCRDECDETQILTAFFAVLDPAMRTMVYCSAGHEPPVICRAHGGCEEIEAMGMPLGVMPDISYEQSSLRLEPGDIVVVVTDGITEARAPGCVLYGKTQLIDYVQRHRRVPLEEIAEGVLEAATQHACGRLQDDAAVVVFAPSDEQIKR